MQTQQAHHRAGSIRPRALWTLAVISIALAAIWFLQRHPSAGEPRITLDVRNAPLAEVLRRINRQTIAALHVQEGVDGLVTLQVREMPLSRVLTILGEQLQLTTTRIFTIYRNRAQRDALLAGLTFREAMPGPGWTHLPEELRSREFEVERILNPQVSLSLHGLSAAEAARRLSEAANTHVAVEDGLRGAVTFEWNGISPREGVAAIARALKADWEEWIILTRTRGSDLRQESSERIMREDDLGAGIVGGGPKRIRRLGPPPGPGPHGDPTAEGSEVSGKAKGLQPAPFDPHADIQARMLEDMKQRWRYTTPEQRVDRYRQRAAREQMKASVDVRAD